MFIKNISCSQVTGGSSGIGKAVAIEVARLGGDVTIVARDVNKLKSALEEINNNKVSDKQRITYISVDVSQNYNVLQEKIQEIENNVGPIYMLVNCVGQAVCNKFDCAPDSDFRDMLNVNYLGAVYPSQIIGRLMKDRKEGCIVICGSQASLLGVFGMSAYCGAKFALRGYAESLYMEMIPYGVSVTICVPPDTRTPGFEIENLTKPEETRLISQTSGLFEPVDVAQKLLADSLRKRFFSYVGIEGFLLTTLCSGMSPFSSVSELILQVSLMSFFRLLSVFYLLHFRNIIRSCSRTTQEKNE
ncbi:UNVERIFIED_CONTAM: hypothetical protein PYX00_008720 [Menopon gallinae]|uniref:3-dehydrosphinganine reductase n=1 Tax=Menopon gallinae TaxID=328185 RepID=A0AAW2HPZ8_9NEOP